MAGGGPVSHITAAKSACPCWGFVRAAGRQENIPAMGETLAWIVAATTTTAAEDGSYAQRINQPGTRPDGSTPPCQQFEQRGVHEGGVGGVEPRAARQVAPDGFYGAQFRVGHLGYFQGVVLRREV